MVVQGQVVSLPPSKLYVLAGLRGGHLGILEFFLINPPLQEQ